MCGRFNVTADPLSELLLDLVGVAHPGPDNFNTAPTETVVVLRASGGGTDLVPMRWWLTPFWAKEMSSRYSMFNAKSESITKSRAYREPFRTRRCVVPISGFYEWARLPASDATGTGRKQAYYLTSEEHPGLLLAGVWDRWHDADGERTVESFSVLTTAALPSMRFVHSRQPVMLAPADAATWMNDGAEETELLALCAPERMRALIATPVSPHVNNARNKDARCMHPVGEPIAIRSAA